jgi:hypothetical protein
MAIAAAKEACHSRAGEGPCRGSTASTDKRIAHFFLTAFMCVVLVIASILRVIRVNPIVAMAP